MKISTRGRYALRMMLDLAENQGSGVVALKDIAARQDISKKYLEQIIPVLNRAGLLQTSRGFQGDIGWRRCPRTTPWVKFSGPQREDYLPWPVWSSRPTPVPAATSAKRCLFGRAWSRW